MEISCKYLALGGREAASDGVRGTGLKVLVYLNDSDTGLMLTKDKGSLSSKALTALTSPSNALIAPLNLNPDPVAD